MLHLMESLTYETDPATTTKVGELATTWWKSITETPANQLESKKGEIMQVHNAVKYLVRFKMLPESFPLNEGIRKLIKDNSWDK